MPKRKCHCAGHCGPAPVTSSQSATPAQVSGVTGPSRREFIGMMGAATAAMLVPGTAWAAFQLPEAELKRWQGGLLESKPRRYFSDIHTDARLHLGGIGTGNLEIGADGQLTTWQLFNTLRDGYVPFYFGLKTSSGAKLLQTAGGPDWPRVARLEMTAAYPAAVLRADDESLPVKVEWTAFTPFVPLDAGFSSIPVAIFHFRLHNPTATPQEVSFGAFMANPIGYDGLGELKTTEHPSVGWNINENFEAPGAAGVLFHARAGKNPLDGSETPSVNRPVTIFVSDRFRELNSPPHDHPAALKLEFFDPTGAPDFPAAPGQTVIWLDEPGLDVTAAFLRAASAAVQSGASLVFSGRDLPLLDAAAPGGANAAQSPGNPSAQPDIVFEDFESGYGQWTVTGEAFGPAPAAGTLPGQQPVTGFLGHGLVNSFFGGDDSTGRLVSRPFAVSRRFIRFLVGGGSRGETEVRLLVNGRVVRAAAGRDREKLEPRTWDVREFLGQTVHLEIVDEGKGGWGHINVDQIVFSDSPAAPEVVALLGDLLPAPDAPAGPSLGGLAVRTRRVGQGQVAVVQGQILDPAFVRASTCRQRVYAELCALCASGDVKYALLDGQFAKAPGFGTVALAAADPRASVVTYGHDLDAAWSQFASSGQFDAPPNSSDPAAPTPPGQTRFGAVASTVTIPPGGSAEIPFLLAWHYPNKYNDETGAFIGCHYATRWPDAASVLRDALDRRDTLRARTETFGQTMAESTLPYWLTDCLTANAGIIRHIGVVFEPGNGDIYGWEGSNGCCDPTCTHVWGYEQTLARLFPAKEREMRRIDFFCQQNPDGGINNRTAFPSPGHPTGEHPFADGHASCILKAYREALNTKDESFFRDYWPHVRRAVEYLIDRDAKGAGGQPEGALQDDQWNTYDEALHGISTFISGYYLAALRAGEEWARRMGDGGAADRFHDIFLRGQKKLVDLCWNGEYFQQHLPDYRQRHGEFGPGCMSDQLLGQWWAHQLDLGYLLPRDMVQSAMRSVFKYNFKSDLTGWHHAPRAFAGTHDKGLIVCTWPKGGRPENVLLYSDELWTGMEYQVAGHLLYEGMITEGLSVAKAARDRYDGIPRPPIPRNPWCEIECGGHYARAMSSWSILLAVTGFYSDGPRGLVRFAPRLTPQNFRSFFTAPEGWGSYAQDAHGAKLTLREGQLSMKTLELPAHALGRRVSVRLGGQELAVTTNLRGALTQVQFGAQGVTLHSGDTLTIGRA